MLALQARLEAAEQRITDKDAVIADLRHRLDDASRQLTVAQQQVGEVLTQMKLLTDQRRSAATDRSWWRFWRQPDGK